MIRLVNVVKNYKTKDEMVCALDNINYTLPNTGFVGLCGENGCGKTTLLNLISTIDSDFIGDIFIDDLSVKKNKDIIRYKKISYVFQENYFIDNLNIEENLLFLNSNISSIDSLLNEFDIKEKKKFKSNTLSGGQKQRVSMLCGLLKDYNILLVDEPTSSMNEEMERYVFNLLKELSKTKLVILVSHNLTMLYSYANIVIKLNDGKIENIINNTTISDVKYIDNKIIFNNDINFKAIDNKIANNMIDNYNEIIIQKIKEETSNITLNYDIKKEAYSNIGYMDKVNLKILFKSLAKYLSKIILGFSLFMSLLLFILEAIIDLNSFDSNVFIYNTLRGNGETLVNASYRPLAKDDRFTNLYYEYIINNYSLRIDKVSKYENNLCFGYESDEFYSNKIYSLNKSNFYNTNFLKGVIPTDFQSFVITDYTADSYILKTKEYTSYDDIINLGINIDGYVMRVSGIIDTDYEEYKNKYDRLSEKETNNFYHNLENLYSSIYIRANIDNNIDSLGLIYVNSGEFYTDLKCNNTITNDKCIVNEAFSELVGYDGSNNFSFKFEGGYISIDSVVIDGNNNPTMYVNNDRFNYSLTSRNNQFDSINIEILDNDLVEFLNNKSLAFNSYSGSYMYRIIDILDILNYLFIAFIVILIIGIFICVVLSIKKYFILTMKTYVFHSIYGYKRRYLFNIEFSLLMCLCLITVIVNIVFYVVLYKVINFILSSLFNTNVHLFIYKPLTMIIASIVILSFIVIIYLLLYILRDKKNLIKFINAN